MVAGNGTSSSELLSAVRELTGEVKSLRKMLTEEYPKRTEMKAAMRKRALTYAAVILLVLATAQVLTMTTISHCFLISTPRPPFGCTLIPGYSDAVKQGDQRMQRFYEISAEIDNNRIKLAELELEIERLKKER